MKPVSMMFVLGGLLVLSACADEKVIPQKSPCTGIAGSPCGDKRPVNGLLNTMPDTASAAIFITL